MRILFAFAGGSGHFEPLVPMARSGSSNASSMNRLPRPCSLVHAMGHHLARRPQDAWLTTISNKNG